MYYSVSEISKQLNISKVTVYKKLDKISELKDHIKQLKDGKCVTEEGLEIIRQSLQLTPLTNPLPEELKEDTEKPDSSSDLIIYKQLIESLENQVNCLKEDKQKLYEQLDTKDKHIDSLADALNTAQRLNENSQILLRQQQDKILFLESPPTKERKSIWDMFKRS
jgi:hypothetical protein